MVLKLLDIAETASWQSAGIHRPALMMACDKGMETIMNFETKQDLVDFINEQFGIILENDENHPLNRHPDFLYTEIPRGQRNSILSFFRKRKIETNEHLNGKYWIYLKNIVE